MMDIQEFYQTIYTLIEDLKTSGDVESAARLSNGLDGCTSGEVLCNLGLALNAVETTLAEPYGERVRAAQRYVDDALRPRRR